MDSSFSINLFAFGAGAVLADYPVNQVTGLTDEFPRGGDEAQSSRWGMR